MFRLSTVFICFCSIIAAYACSPIGWIAQTEKEYDIFWPPPPNPTKVKYLGKLTGFKQEGKSIVNILTGKNPGGRLNKPVSIAVGNDNRMAIADLGSKGVHLYFPANKKYIFINDAEKIRLNSPVSICFDSSLQLYVSDSFHKKIFIYDNKGKFIRIIDSYGKNQFGEFTKAAFIRPTGVTFVPFNSLLYIVDTGSNQVHIFNEKGQFQNSFGARGTGTSEFNFPTHIAADASGTIIVNDAMNFRVQLFNNQGKLVSMFGHHGDGSGDFAMPKGVAIDRWGAIYVVDTLFDTVQLFDEKGGFLLAIGSKGTETGEFWLPSGIFIDHNDKLYVCDTYNDRIQIFQLAKGVARGGTQ